MQKILIQTSTISLIKPLNIKKKSSENNDLKLSAICIPSGKFTSTRLLVPTDAGYFKCKGGALHNRQRDSLSVFDTKYLFPPLFYVTFCGNS